MALNSPVILAAFQVFATDQRSPIVYQNGAATVLGRLSAIGASGAAVLGEGFAVQQADLTSIVRTVYDLDISSQGLGVQVPVLGPTTLTIANVINQSLQTAGAWVVDQVGWNFQDAIPPAAFPSPDHLYRIAWAITTSGSVVCFAQINVRAKRTNIQ